MEFHALLLVRTIQCSWNSRKPSAKTGGGYNWIAVDDGLIFPAVGEELAEFRRISVDSQAWENIVEIFREVDAVQSAASGEAA